MRVKLSKKSSRSLRRRLNFKAFSVKFNNLIHGLTSGVPLPLPMMLLRELVLEYTYLHRPCLDLESVRILLFSTLPLDLLLTSFMLLMLHITQIKRPLFTDSFQLLLVSQKQLHRLSTGLIQLILGFSLMMLPMEQDLK